nr:MAG TPA: hypothetical protein [Bacteriophage sp.]
MLFFKLRNKSFNRFLELSYLILFEKYISTTF